MPAKAGIHAGALCAVPLAWIPACAGMTWSGLEHPRGATIGSRNSTMYDFAYQRPGSLDEAAKVLAADPDAKALAGGMTLIPVLKQRLNRPSVVVDLAKIGLVGIRP